MFPIEISLYENQRRLTPFGAYDAANLMPRAMGDPAAYAQEREFRRGFDAGEVLEAFDHAIAFLGPGYEYDDPDATEFSPRWIDHDGPGDVDGWVYARDYKTEMMRWYEAHCDSKMLDAWASPATAGAATHLFRQRKLTRTARMKRQFHVSPFALVGR